MAVKGNSSSEKTTLNKDQYTGMTGCSVVFVNPTKAQLETIGKTFTNEPTYVSEDGVRLDFWVTPDLEPNSIYPNKVYDKCTLFLNKGTYASEKEAGTVKLQYINKYGKCAWGTSPETAGENASGKNYFLNEGVRKAIKGEEDLHKFLAAFLNTKYNTKTSQYDECIIDNPEALLAGNVSELTTIINSYKDNTVRLLWGVNDKGYQTIYNKFFERTSNNPNYKAWNEALSNSYTQFKADYQGDFTFKIYVGQTAPTADAESSTNEAF